ncbi:MAG TPA: hypothetical protein VFI78_07915 [Salinimicrobium sp.]|nr:hypothetical protein [Salinimicrobium sp.]
MNLLYKSKYFASYQCDTRRCFYFDFGEESISLSFCQLLALRNKVNAINLESHFNSDLNKHGIEILMLCNREHILILDTLQVIDLKDLLKATFGMLELNALAEYSL